MTDRGWQELRPRPERCAPVVRSYEVHVEGRLGAAMLRYLRWSNRRQPEQSVVRVQSRPDDLPEFLSCCAAYGLTVDRVTRVDPVPQGNHPHEIEGNQQA